MSTADHLGLRADLEGLLRRDLLGPRDAAEEIRSRPESQYVVGILHPAFSQQDGAEEDEALTATSDDDPPDAYAAYGGMKQSAIGLSFTTSHTSEPAVIATYADYERLGPEESESDENATTTGELAENVDEDPDGGGPIATRQVRSGWRRIPITSPALTLVDEAGNATVGDGIEIRWRGRARGGDRIWTVSLVNRRTGPRARPIFQSALEVRLADGGRFVARPPVNAVSDPDERLSALLYRDEPEVAVGHGCAVDWTVVDGHVTSVRTEFLPRYEVPAVVPAEDTGAVLEQGRLAGLSDASRISAALRPIVTEYESWIEGQRRRIPTLDVQVRAIAATNMKRCEAAAARITAGIELVEQDAAARDAFRFMNAAMDRQRRQSVAAAEFRRTGRWPAGQAEVPRWRPFQLAFILSNLPGIVDPTSRDRQTVDLLWFPTGGGKTEAYLGLTAFAIALRRLREQAGLMSGQGITVLMRYTLRLLTTQQFERATTLVAACESLRRNSPDTWGTKPITIGLWVGLDATPNRYDQARAKRDELIGKPDADRRHPFVLRVCPWCGSVLRFPGSFQFDDAKQTVSVVCGRPDCEFGTAPGLPVLVVDDNIYRHPPSVLLATVDKFARMPWVPDAASLFGRAIAECDTHGFVGDSERHQADWKSEPAPRAVSEGPGIALIIQDELHLISGPLGTMVGLYEIAVEFLGGREGIPPKLIASTATIRSAVDQVSGLYGREPALFPPPALDPFETFFSRRASPGERPGRTFIGVTAPGSSVKTSLIRVYASLLSGALALSSDPKIRDPYWTLVGYFNSLRELGGALSLMYDDVPKRVAALTRQDGRPPRDLFRIAELTSRIPTYEIPNRLREMEQPAAEGRALDTLLASNMISVGVDIDRLGLMVVAGQPKSTAEYIQATSRVGRQHPGLIVAVYNWTRPRDLSHYERFRSYHSALYRHVETTSVTPLSPRARDRGLQAVLVSVLRLAMARLRANSDAAEVANIERSEPILVEFLRFFTERASRTQVDEAGDAIDHLEASLDHWVSRAQLAPDLTYERTRSAAPHHLLRPAVDDASGAFDVQQQDSQAWRIPNSLRSVEREHNWFRR